jgi:hypothetical protein
MGAQYEVSDPKVMGTVYEGLQFGRDPHCIDGRTDDNAVCGKYFVILIPDGIVHDTDTRFMAGVASFTG